MGKIDKIKSEGQNFKDEFEKKITGYVVAAFGLVAGLAWNEAIKSLIEYFFPMQQNTMLAKFAYAILITLVLVLATIYFTKFVNRDSKDKKRS